MRSVESKGMFYRRNRTSVAQTTQKLDFTRSAIVPTAISHRRTVAIAAAWAEQSRREQILIDEGIGLCPFV
jgi:hypothetical protein